MHLVSLKLGFCVATGASAAAILVIYHVNKGTVVLPKSVTKRRISSNKEFISLSSKYLSVLESLTANSKAKRINTSLSGFALEVRCTSFEESFAIAEHERKMRNKFPRLGVETDDRHV
ncbi:hypothetical protein FPOAC1_003707 [Fusarium poae]|uniref:hypothetical protein n=1 Tax=Fusarium poae TaxID=36050 RepID=UPI001CE9F690|nr:hypothetical protein FPOAC1_003707 [Fusarium poae]KAG8677680.1 hypothetical protein FPOAC1_003707 [Fusarium poae]